VSDERPWADPTKPGRLDVNGVEWWACDPYPTWYRWENGEVRTNHAAFVDSEAGRKIRTDQADANDAVQRAIIPLFEGEDPGALVRTVGWLHVAQAALDGLQAAGFKVVRRG
jgi:hypothetical protein